MEINTNRTRVVLSIDELNDLIEKDILEELITAVCSIDTTLEITEGLAPEDIEFLEGQGIFETFNFFDEDYDNLEEQSMQEIQVNKLYNMFKNNIDN